MPIHESLEDGIARLTLDVPPLNILTRAALAEIRDGLETLANEDGLRALVISSRGKHFSAGADVGEHLPPHHRDLIPEFVETVEALESFPLPTLAAVQGRCLGGGFELVQAVDLVIAAEGATFGQPEIRLGVFPPAACALLPTLLPHGAAAELLFTGEPITAGEAARLGWVRRVVPLDELETATLELARGIARNSPAALRLTKKAMLAELGPPRARAVRRAGAIYLDDLMRTTDAIEGLSAFVEKREPRWTGR